MTQKINLNDRRRDGTGTYCSLYAVSVKRSEISQVDLATVSCGDWIEGIGDVNEYAIIGFLHELACAGIRLVPDGDRP